MTTFPLRPTDINLIRQEVEAQGELISKERLERKAEIDELYLRFEALKQTMEIVYPGFLARYQETYERLVQEYDPEKRSA